MKKSHKFAVLILCTLFLCSFALVSTSTANSFSERLKGRILLQIEDNGEAWYIYPNDGMKYYLGRPMDAWNIMRALGMGITNADLNRIPMEADSWDGESDLINRLKGRILIQVEDNGEAWYVYPINGKRYYLGRPVDAFKIMRNLGLGITNSDLSKIPNKSTPIKEEKDTSEKKISTSSQCSSDKYNCSDFSTQSQAQEVFNQCFKETGKDIHGLDQDNNKIVCESIK
ncbi:hypothetical protein KKH43_05960 [Patescibacteria group bacterium]|nr:hypothetical protein [Patescibacteria group bacterium]